MSLWGAEERYGASGLKKGTLLPVDPWLRDLRTDLDRLKSQDLLRALRPAEAIGRTIRRGGRELVNLATNDYLGLSAHPRLRDAAIAAVTRWGAGSGASRLVSGHLPLHAEVEAKFAAFKHAEAALLLPTGYTANHAAITALAGPGDLICLDKLDHASLIDAAHATGAEVRVFPHLGYGKLERLLARTREAKGEGRRATEKAFDDDHPSPLAPRPSRRFIVTDSVFSMDGDTADLPALCDLADRFDAILMVDEAHGTGVLGHTGAGLGEHQGVAQRIDVVTSTASKALGGLGGVITARREVIETIVNRARSFIFSTGVPPAQAAAIGAAIDVLRNEPWRRERLKAITRDARRRLGEIGWLPEHHANQPVAIPIIPLIVGSPADAIRLSAHLESRGFFAPAIRPPTVAPGASRVRLSLRADLVPAEVASLLEALHAWDGPRLVRQAAAADPD